MLEYDDTEGSGDLGQQGVRAGLVHLAEAQTAKEHVLGRAGELVVAGVEGELNDLFVGGVTGFGPGLKSSTGPSRRAAPPSGRRDAAG